MLQRFKYLAITYSATLALMMMLKIVFLVVYSSLTSECGCGDIFNIFWHGLALDISITGYISILPLLMLIISSWFGGGEVIWRKIFMGYYVLISLVTAVITAGDVSLYEYWGFRLDSSVLFYLESPQGAMASVVLRDVVVYTLSFVVVLSAMFYTYRWVIRQFCAPKLKWWQSIITTLAMVLLGGVIFVGIRGGVTASTANLSKVYFSNKTYLNHAAVNPIFSLLSTLGEEDDFIGKYQFFSAQTLQENIEKFNPRSTPQRDSVLTTSRPNILFIIGESFSESIFNMQVNQQWIMPNLRKLASEGIYFPNAIANSFRTDRGVATALYGFPAQPRTSIMKYPSKSRKLPSLARKLEEVGYATEFIYGGDLNFTDMASMLYSTGWQQLKWQQNIKGKGINLSKWGYDDMTMVDIVTQSVMESYSQEKPFLTGWLTLSSHEPFDVPVGAFNDKILDSHAFADQAVGDVIEALRQSPVWDNLLVIIVADHAYRYPAEVTYNSLQRHRVPLIWCGGAVAQPREIESYVSQMDIVTTLLSQMNIDTSDFEFSRDIMSDNYEGRGYYAFSDGFGVVTANGHLVYDNSKGEVITFAGDTTALESHGKSILQHTMEVLSEY